MEYTKGADGETGLNIIGDDGGVTSSPWPVPEGRLKELVDAFLAAGGTIEAAETLDEAKARRGSQVDSACKNYLTSKYDASTMSALLNYLVAGNAAQQALCAGISAWTNTVMVEAVTRQGAVLAAETIEAVDAVSLDFSAFDETKPATIIADVIQAT